MHLMQTLDPTAKLVACVPHQHPRSEANAAVTTTAPADLLRAAAQPTPTSRQTARHSHSKNTIHSNNRAKTPKYPAALAPATTAPSHNAAHRSPPRSAAPIKHPTAAESKQQPGARTRTILTIHAHWFREHGRKPSHPELRGDLWHPGELPRNRGT